jgi:osmotically-inducible protein OsmY
MIRNRAGRTLIFVFVCLLIPSAVYAQVEAVDLTAVFLAGGIEIDQLMVYKISDIVLIRGRTSDVAMAAEAGRFAKSLGYQRLANLIEIVPGLADSAIERYAGRNLEMARGLEGCTFQVSSRKGVVSLRGQIRREVQKDLAVELIRKIDGVKAVRFE